MHYKCVHVTETIENFLINNSFKKNPCSPNPCQNDGICKEYKRAFICLCKNGKQGYFIEKIFSLYLNATLINIFLGFDCTHKTSKQ